MIYICHRPLLLLIRHSLIGNVEGSAKHRECWLKKMEELGKAGI